MGRPLAVERHVRQFFANIHIIRTDSLLAKRTEGTAIVFADDQGNCCKQDFSYRLRLTIINVT